ncbi:hypothetical protein [Nocardia brevicatena]|uniref:hypothetical protein n=1 Tax=Nocardia brevicatena TaxID=37327 RepID=UPI0002F84AA4|nr:hypothetical protein [Nocardia brevicatena]
MDLDITCPHCGHIDFVQSVSALHADGVSTSYDTHEYSGVGVTTAGLVPVFGTAKYRTHPHDRTGPKPCTRPARKPSGRLTVVGLLLLIPAVLALIPAILTVVVEDPEVSRWT